MNARVIGMHFCVAKCTTSEGKCMGSQTCNNRMYFLNIFPLKYGKFPSFNSVFRVTDTHNTRRAKRGIFNRIAVANPQTKLCNSHKLAFNLIRSHILLRLLKIFIYLHFFDRNSYETSFFFTKQIKNATRSTRKIKIQLRTIYTFKYI